MQFNLRGPARSRKEPERITLNVADLLDDLIRQADELVGKPVALMTKDDKVKAIRYLSNIRRADDHEIRR